MTQEVSPFRGNFLDHSAAFTAGGTAETAAAMNQSRKYLIFQNISDTAMWVDFGATAVADKPSLYIAAGGVLTFETGFVPVAAVSVMCASTGKKYVLKEGV